LFIGCSPNASITSELLVEMLSVIDRSGVFPRTEDLGVTFLLLDGHHSRTRLPFLSYINDEAHKWQCCIGVPYATHVWQPADSSELNGSFKIKLTSEKINYMKKKVGDKKGFVSTDVVPIVNKAWPLTLGNKDFAKKAITERGWGPLTYVLLDDPRLIPYDNVANNKFVSDLEINTINKNGKVFNNTLDLLMCDCEKCSGRKRHNEEMKKLIDSKRNKIETINNMMGISSGKLAVENIFCLTNEDLLDKARKMENEK
jgi:hypothetical protein